METGVVDTTRLYSSFRVFEDILPQSNSSIEKYTLTLTLFRHADERVA